MPYELSEETARRMERAIRWVEAQRSGPPGVNRRLAMVRPGAWKTFILTASLRAGGQATAQPYVWDADSESYGQDDAADELIVYDDFWGTLTGGVGDFGFYRFNGPDRREIVLLVCATY